MTTKLVLRLKGGAGSGNFGHKGRPGQVGGSMPKDSASDAAFESPKDVASPKSIEEVKSLILKKKPMEGWEVVKVPKLRYPNLSEDEYQITFDGKKYGMWIENSTSYRSYANSRLRDTSKTRYEISIELRRYPTEVEKINGRVWGEQLSIKSTSATGEWKNSDDIIAAAKDSYRELVSRVVGIPLNDVRIRVR